MKCIIYISFLREKMLLVILFALFGMLLANQMKL